MRGMTTAIGLTFLFAGQVSAQQETTVDHPTKALREGPGGTMRVAGIVGIDGRAKSCEIVRSSGSPDLDAATCDMMMKQGRWKPARDTEGKPIEGRYKIRFNW